MNLSGYCILCENETAKNQPVCRSCLSSMPPRDVIRKLSATVVCLRQQLRHKLDMECARLVETNRIMAERNELERKFKEKFQLQNTEHV